MEPVDRPSPPGPVGGRWWRRHVARPGPGDEDRWDGLLDVALLIAVVVRGSIAIRDGAAAEAVVLAAVAVVLLLRRRHLQVATAVVCALAVVAVALGAEPTVYAVLTCAALFSAAMHVRSRSVLVLAAGVLVVLTATVAGGGDGSPLVVAFFTVATWTALALGLGSAVRANRDYVQALEHEATAVRAARASETARHVTDERLRIARDLHDAVAHSIAAINMQAGAAERHVRTDPARAEDALREVRRASRTVLLELRDIVAVLRSTRRAEDDDVMAGVSAAGVPALLADARARGDAVRAELDVDLEGIEPAVGAALYRVVQEALTNAHRHGDGEVTVTVRDEEDVIVVDVVNPAARRDRSAGGYGLVGMRERVEQAGGRLETRADAGVFGVHAWLPRARHPVRRDDGAGQEPAW